ncbi:hypothetical protein [Actinorugispora endophytica]|uniref:Uncharacterized protein n=1 Tax=Actinorugispora endophytica TaxID=1605990 RepID=A0A4R6V515_9ACTN|nr:hypothetical protein [Actinorugispora endophytica]TDQ55431.1 hypothetical protein EV190_101758 [Actinorugispora endophytica]
MAMPEESASRNRDTAQVSASPEDSPLPPGEARPTLGAELRDRMEEKGVGREDFGEG